MAAQPFYLYLRDLFGTKGRKKAALVLNLIGSRGATEKAVVRTRNGEVLLMPGDAVVGLSDMAKHAGVSISYAFWIVRCLVAAGIIERVRPSGRGKDSIYRVASWPPKPADQRFPVAVSA
jgi:hypothetical protein